MKNPRNEMKWRTRRTKYVYTVHEEGIQGHLWKKYVMRKECTVQQNTCANSKQLMHSYILYKHCQKGAFPQSRRKMKKNEVMTGLTCIFIVKVSCFHLYMIFYEWISVLEWNTVGPRFIGPIGTKYFSPLSQDHL